MIQKIIAITIFCIIMCIPFVLWQFGVNHSSNSGNGSGLDFLLGMTAIIWIPLLAMISWSISKSLARLVWPENQG